MEVSPTIYKQNRKSLVVKVAYIDFIGELFEMCPFSFGKAYDSICLYWADYAHTFGAAFLDEILIRVP